jgi:hypothetical protein
MNTTYADMSRWLVTSSNPPRQTDGLDYGRCAVLHNYIVAHGWIGSGFNPAELPRRTWFDTYRDEADEQRENLHDSVVEFLKRAWDVTEDMTFFYWVSRLSPPEQLWEDHPPDLAEDGEELRFFTLYPMNVGFGGHPDGLKCVYCIHMTVDMMLKADANSYDQHTFKAIVQSDIADDERTRREDHPPPWQPLETILSAWIDMIHVKKIQAMPKGTTADNEIYHPWVSVWFSDAQLEDTINAFNGLVKAIESGVNAPSSLGNHQGQIIEDYVLDNTNIPRDCFARAFLSKARRPNFTFVAPGISLPDPDTFGSDNVIPIITDEFHTKTVPPIRILDAKGHLSSADTAAPPFDLPYNKIRHVPCGLHIPNADLMSDTVEEASARLVLPFRLGNNNYAWKSDTSRFYNAVDLYQPGFNAFSGDWLTCVRLIRVFDSWRHNVESGEWQVGPDGVIDDINKFKDADTEQRWERYYLAPDW